MQASQPKQFMPLRGLPVVMHAITAFRRSQYAPKIILVLHPEWLRTWDALCSQFGFALPHEVAPGGHSRFESVRNGLEAVVRQAGDLARSLIAVHDGARPLITPMLIDQTFKQAAETGAAALAVTSSCSVRVASLNGRKNNAVDRNRVYLMQTPQTFNGQLLVSAYAQPESPLFTDEASVVEQKGYPVTLVPGDTRNIKITFPEDLPIAEILAG